MKGIQNWKRWSGVLKIIFGTGIIFFFLYYIFSNLFRNLHDLREHSWIFHPGHVFLGLFVLTLLNLFAPLIWWMILRSLGGNLSPLRAFRIWAFSLAGRYAPGKIWGIVGRVYLARDVNRTLVLSSMGIEIALIVMSGFILSLVLLPILKTDVIIFQNKTLFFLPLIIVLLHPRLLEWILLKVTKQHLRLNTLKLLGWFFSYIVFWLGTGVGYFLILRGAGIKIDLSTMIVVFPISWILGFLSPFAPGGIGVREGALTFLLTPLLGPGISSLTALITRLASTILDLSLIGIATLVQKIEKTRNSYLTESPKTS